MASSLFQKYGLREATLTELNTLIDTYERAVREWKSARDRRRGRVRTSSALEEGAAIVQRLDPIVHDLFANDPGVLAMWERDRRVGRARVYRRRITADSTAVAEPPASAAPASVPAPPPVVTTAPAAGKPDAEREVA